MQPTLYIFSGLPGSGKTTLARELARHLGAAYLRIDTIEQGLRDLCSIDVQGEGYRLSYEIASDNLGLGTSVIADSCNPIELTRREWRDTALTANAAYVNIEVICSDVVEHRQRVLSRGSTIPGLKLPTWHEIEQREYDPWSEPTTRVDTAGRGVTECVDVLLSQLGHGD